MASLKSTELPLGLFPQATRPSGSKQSEGLQSGTTTAADTTPAGSILLRTEDVTATNSIHEGDGEEAQDGGLANSSISKDGTAGKTSKAKAKALDGDGDKLILVQFGENDKEDPQQWSLTQKWILTILLNSMTMCIGLSTSAYSVGIGKMTDEFGVANVAGQVGMFTFNGACAIMPLFIAPFCELSGRRIIYVSAFAAFFAVTFMLAFGQNLATQIVGRLLQGAFGSIGTILVGGSLSDVWSTKEISVPMSLFSFCAIVSTVGAPAYSGYIDERLGWRWIQYVHLILTGVVLLFELCFLKESRGDAILRSRAKRLRKETGDERFRARAELEGDTLMDMFRASCLRSIKLLFTESVILFFGLYIALCWMTVFLFLSVIPLTFAGNHEWSEGNAGLPYIAAILACFAGFGLGLWQDKMYERSTRNNGGVAKPEYRLYGAMIFGPLFGIGIMIFSWTQFAFVHWIAPILAIFLIILGTYAVFLAVYSYTADCYPSVASSAIAGQGLLRNGMAAASPLYATYMFEGMRYQFAGLLLALIALALAPLPFILYRYGDTIRARSKHAVQPNVASPEARRGVDAEEKIPSQRSKTSSDNEKAERTTSAKGAHSNDRDVEQGQ
ncbi:MFS general substrate transporter [Ceraceosorus guamensis]|uniref:MFS general substrate transporter n=1 Tax=Ceraceosorus guamensis TaxID=1522189 RepID=A0A316VN59_9BASI|nr:MFS general substrate transporter [Ceraceosorus guamensis]PWN38997.1 MFS general substrate transporter [Ceraceosorus guamensis]